MAENKHVPLEQVDRVTLGFYLQRLGLLQQEQKQLGQNLDILLARIINQAGKDTADWVIDLPTMTIVPREKPKEKVKAKEKVEEKTNA